MVPLGLGAVRRQSRLPEREVRARFELGERRVLLSLSAKRPHKNLLALIDALALIAARASARCWCCPAIRPRTSASCASVHDALGLDGDVRFPGWVSAEELEGLWAMARGVRVPVAVRGLRAAGARGDGARRAGRLLERLLAAGGRRATPRCCSIRATRARDRRCARAACSPIRRCASDWSRWARARSPFSWHRSARLTLATTRTRSARRSRNGRRRASVGAERARARPSRRRRRRRSPRARSAQ